MPESDITVEALFIKDGDAPYFAIGSATSHSEKVGYGVSIGDVPSERHYYTVALTNIFDNLNSAINSANASSTSKIIVLMNNGTLPAGDYTIPSGVTLLIPFDTANTMYTTSLRKNRLKTAFAPFASCFSR